MGISNADARLYSAVKMLGLQHLSLKDRLVHSWTQALSHIDANDLPTNLRPDFEYIVSQLTGNGTVQGVVSVMGDAEIDTISRRIMGLAYAVEQEVARQESLRRSQ